MITQSASESNKKTEISCEKKSPAALIREPFLEHGYVRA